MDSVTAGYGYYNNTQGFNYASNNQTGGGFISGNNQNAQNVNNSNVQF